MITARDALKLAQEWNEKAIAHYEADISPYAQVAATIALTYATMAQSRVLAPSHDPRVTRSGEPMTTTTLGDVSAEQEAVEDELAKRYGSW